MIRVVGINWVWYYTDTKQEAIDGFKELTGVEPPAYVIVEPVKREPADKYDHMYGFRIHL